MPMYNLIEYRNNYFKVSGSLWQYYSDEPYDADTIIDFAGANHNSKSFEYKQMITSQTDNDGEKNVKIMVPFIPWL